MARLELNCKFHFAASHFLTMYHGKCEHLHGHNYKVIITVEDEVKEDGMVMDFKIIKKIVKEKAINVLDHKHLNDIIENPSAEHIAMWIWDKIKDDMPLKKVTVYETEKYYCTYEGK